jgi:hypothetical protein
MNKPIFIVGVPRSGTTLLRLILNAHSRIGIATETHFLRIFWSARQKYGDLEKNCNLDAMWSDLKGSKYLKDLNLKNIEEIRLKVNNGERSYKNIFRTLLTEYAEQRGKVRWGEKTPGHLEFVEDLVAFFPDCKIIHVIRDPRDVCLSFKKVPWGSNNVYSNARLWNRYIDLCENKSFYKCAAYIEVKYEELVTNPKKQIEHICKFIGEKAEDQMLYFYQFAGQYLEKDEPWKNGCFNPLTSENIGKWRRELTKWEVEQINIKCENNMLKKGYLEYTNKLSLAYILLRYLKLFVYSLIWLFRSFFYKLAAIIDKKAIYKT